jgi:hypothetical protein
MVVGRRINQEDTAGSPDRYIPVTTHLVDRLAFRTAFEVFGEGRRPEASLVEAQIGDDLAQLRALVLDLL